MTMTDTPIEPRSFPPPSRADQVKAFIGDLARPFALIVLAIACAVGLLMVGVPSDKLGLALTALGAMYGAKSWEVASSAKQSVAVGVAQANASAAPAPVVVAPVVAAPVVAPTPAPV